MKKKIIFSVIKFIAGFLVFYSLAEWVFDFFMFSHREKIILLGGMFAMIPSFLFFYYSSNKLIKDLKWKYERARCAHQIWQNMFEHAAEVNTILNKQLTEYRDTKNF